MIKEATAPYTKLPDNRVRCDLCPRHCVLEINKVGACRTRKNIDGKLYTLIYGSVSAMAVDPIEKKPLFNFYPGSLAFSISSVGCNLFCKFCQNWHLSQSSPGQIKTEEISPEKIVELAKRYKCESIAYTYNEPIIWWEYVFDVSKIAHKEGIFNVLVTNGYITLEALEELLPHIDAANVDVKAFKDSFYQELCGAPSLKPVLEACEMMKEKGVHVEITNLIIPGYNDDADEIRSLCKWLVESLGPDTPLHFSRFYPYYKMTYVSPTQVSTIEKARKIALEEGVYYVYIGNVPGHDGENTYCPNCGKLLVRRFGFDVVEWNLAEGNKCKYCGEKIAIKGKFVKRGGWIPFII